MYLSTGVIMPQTAKLFSNGHGQAVRLSKEFRFDGREVGIHRAGNSVVLTPLKTRGRPSLHNSTPSDFPTTSCKTASSPWNRNAILVTNNLKEFSRIDGLRLQDWSQQSRAAA
jgi:virulence-associated protein VagC